MTTAPRRLVGRLLLLALTALPLASVAAPAAAAPTATLPADTPTPVNQVFQFMQSGTCTAWSDGSKTSASAYLWIPETCQRVRGLLILCANVPEHKLVGHPAIRAVCAANDLAIVWCTPSFMNFKALAAPGQKKMSEEFPASVGFLQQLLDGLAEKSGYAEIATVPWLPLGESRHLMMVDTLIEQQPERCIAGVYLKNSHLPPTNREVPILVTLGSGQEWAQEKSDIRSKWNNVAPAYTRILNQRKNSPDWTLSYLIDGSSGHFDCSERLTAYVARYIDSAAKARLSADGRPALQPPVLADGYLADLPVPGSQNLPLSAYAQTAPDARARPWYFDAALAKEAQAFADINWEAQTQLPGFLDEQGNDLPHTYNGITRLTSVKLEADGMSFTVRGRLLDEIPVGFVGAGETLAKAPGVPAVEWLSGALEPLGEGRFRIALDRVWLGGAANYVALRQGGSATVRAIIQPANVDLEALRISEGQVQKISFAPLADVKAGTA